MSDALPYAQQATQADPNNAQAFYQLGNLYDYGSGDYVKATAALKRAIGLSAQSAAAWATLGDVYFKQNRNQKAIVAEEQAIKYAPHVCLSPHGVGIDLSSHGRFGAGSAGI